MPHLVILYTPNLEAKTDMTALCRALADTMIAQLDEDGKQVFPTGGTRVLAYPAAHYAVADDGTAGRAAGKAMGWTGGDAGDYAFVYLNLRMGIGRSENIKNIAGESILTRAKTHLDPLFSQNYIGITLQVDEGHEAYNGKHSNIHPLFPK
jgi:5-carboxymethyl-2-hydroxymuconate isomerase